MVGELSESEIESVLAGSILGRIGCHYDGTTYIVPISYAYDNGVVYALTKEGLKLSIMRKNPEVCFEVESQQNMANWQSVIAWGTFSELKGSEQRKIALDSLTSRILPLESSQTTHLYPDWPFRPDNLNEIEGVVFQIALHKKTGRFEQRDQQMNYNQ
ncbi:MAG: pyridoxamine 5'-phosphate oxidase family protein [Chitinophagaceae bacterium]|nr:MAG: pyridoxamine 5'-phosphate oxidase family protein [Chitinophagaceae bacterium]